MRCGGWGFRARPGSQAHVVALILGTLLALGCVPARAFTISTGGTPGCHETITAQAFQAFLLDLPLGNLVPPEDDVWRDLADFTLQQFNVDPRRLTEAQKFLLVSLIVGVRSPDTDGHSVSNLENLRRLHADRSPEGQYLHALRAVDDDGRPGDAAAVEGTRAAVRAAFAEVARLSPTISEANVSEAPYLRAPFYLDFYGRFEVTVLASAYHLGRAAHVLQDSFAHTIRAEAYDLRKIATVFNYIEAITYDFDRGRDGRPHSDSMDDCTESTALADAASRATVDLFLAAREVLLGRDPEAVEHVLDRWLTFAPECDAANGYCGSQRWVELAEDAETEPYIEAMFDCASAPSGDGRAPGAPWLGLVGLWWLRRRWPRRRRVPARQRGDSGPRDQGSATNSRSTTVT